MRRKNLRKENQKQNKSDVGRDGSRAGNSVPFGVAAVLRLDQQIGFAGREDVRLHDFAELLGHLGRFVEFIDLALLRRFDKRRNHDARIENGNGNVLGDGTEISEGLGFHAAFDQSAIDKNAQGKVLWNVGLAGQRRRVGKLRRDDGAVVHIRGQTPRRLFVAVFHKRAHISGD
jgi:hypothetical protein